MGSGRLQYVVGRRGLVLQRRLFAAVVSAADPAASAEAKAGPDRENTGHEVTDRDSARGSDHFGTAQ
jgi:hypothetical protein